MCDSFQEEFDKYLQLIDDLDRRGIYSQDLGARIDHPERRAIIACRIIEANLSTFTAMWESVDMPKNDLITYFETNFAQKVDGCLAVASRFIENRSRTTERILQSLRKTDQHLRTCGENVLGKVVVAALISGMVLVQILLEGETSEFQMNSPNVDSKFLAASLNKAGMKLISTDSKNFDLSCKAVVERAEVLLESNQKGQAM